MDSLVGVNLIQTAALGRSFQLGMLYDCRNDELITGIRFWDKDQLEQNTISRPQINTAFNVTASDSITDKSKLLNIEGGLNLSVLGGLVQVNGAAKYLKDTKTSFKQQRLTLHYHSTSEFKELIVNKLPSENISDDIDTATHVVAGILYGANACFVFDRQVSSDEDKSTVKGEVKVALEKLMGVVSVDGNVDMNKNEKTAVKNFTCTFYGDFQLPSNPTTFEDAMKVFSDLPKLLKDNQELAVPLRVWLYPLHKLHSVASKLQKDISMDLIQETESVIESLNTAEMKCSDLLEDSPAQAFAAFHDKIQQMKHNCYNYKLRLVKKLGSLLPNIRGDVMKETALNDLLQKHEESSFNERDLTEWLKERERESEIIKTVLRRLKDYGAQVEVNIDVILMDLEDGNLVSYTFTSLNCSDTILHKQKVYLSSAKEENVEMNPDIKQKSWLTAEIQQSMRRNLEIFKNLKNSTDRKPAKFIVSSKEMENNPGSCILLYEDGCDEAVCFTPPSKPVCPVTEEVKGQSVVLKLVPSLCPDTVELRLLYKVKQDTDWRSEPVLKDQDTVTLTDLRSGAEYEIKCAALGKLNYTRESDVITVKTERNMSSAEMSEISSSPDDPVIRVLLMGRNSSGKSSSGNTLLGEKRFIVKIKQKKHEAENQFSEVCEGQTQIGGKQVFVIDCPDLLDPDLNKNQLKMMKEQLISRCSAGLSAVLLVVPVVTNVENEEEMLDYIQCLLGPEVQKYIMILFTHGDELEELYQTIDEHLQNRADLQRLVTECGGKFHCFNNKRKSDDQKQELLQKIEGMMTRNGLKYKMKPMNKKASKNTPDLLLLGESSAEDPDETDVIPERKDQIRLVLLGKTGSGKSATANTIIGRNLFKCSAGSTSVTKQCQSETRVRFGKEISVIDTPGLYDTKLSKEEVITEIAKCITYSSPGPHAFIIVVRVGRFTEEEKNTIKELKEMFGEQIEKYTMIIFTHKDQLEEENETIEQYLQNGDSDLKTLIDGCRNQFFCLDNKSASFPQFKDLISKIEKMVEENGGHFTYDQFEGTEKLLQMMKLDERFKLLGLAEGSRCDDGHLIREDEFIEAVRRSIMEIGDKLDQNSELNDMLKEYMLTNISIRSIISSAINRPGREFSFVDAVKVIFVALTVSGKRATRSMCTIQ